MLWKAVAAVPAVLAANAYTPLFVFAFLVWAVAMFTAVRWTFQEWKRGG
jgi:hypothetical protein